MGNYSVNMNNAFPASIGSYFTMPQSSLYSNYYFLNIYQNSIFTKNMTENLGNAKNQTSAANLSADTSQHPNPFFSEKNIVNYSLTQSNPNLTRQSRLGLPSQQQGDSEDLIANKNQILVNQTKPKDSTIMTAAEVIPQLRRIEGVSNSAQKGDYATAVGALGLFALNIPADWVDTKSAYYQIREKFMHDGKYKEKYDYKGFQHDFSFFRDTALEKWIHKKDAEGKKWAGWLLNNDKSLADVKTGKKILKKFNIKKGLPTETKMTDFDGKPIKAYSYEGSIFKEITGRAMRRTTKLGLIAMGLLEVPKILKSMTNGDSIGQKAKNTASQTVKSGINIAFTTAGIAYCGAIGSKYGKGLGSLFGMGVGAIIGNKISNKVQNIIP